MALPERRHPARPLRLIRGQAPKEPAPAPKKAAAKKTTKKSTAKKAKT
jgi:hypothetical protein